MKFKNHVTHIGKVHYFWSHQFPKYDTVKKEKDIHFTTVINLSRS